MSAQSQPTEAEIAYFKRLLAIGTEDLGLAVPQNEKELEAFVKAAHEHSQAKLLEIATQSTEYGKAAFRHIAESTWKALKGQETGYGTTQKLKEQLKSEGYSMVSWCKNSIPTSGSLCKNIDLFTGDVHITKRINHKDGSVTVKTEKGYLRFWK